MHDCQYPHAQSSSSSSSLSSNNAGINGNGAPGQGRGGQVSSSSSSSLEAAGMDPSTRPPLASASASSSSSSSSYGRGHLSATAAADSPSSAASSSSSLLSPLPTNATLNPYTDVFESSDHEGDDQDDMAAAAAMMYATKPPTSAAAADQQYVAAMMAAAATSGQQQQQQQQQQQSPYNHHVSPPQYGYSHQPQQQMSSAPAASGGGAQWYDPEGADSYTLAQVFMAAQQYGQHAPQQQQQMMSAGPSNFQQQDVNAYQSFRDVNGGSDNVGPSPFASPATSHHRASSFGSEIGSPSPLFPAAQHPFQHQQQQQGWNNGGISTEIAGFSGISLGDETGGMAAMAPAPSSGGYPDGSLEQLIAQQQGQEQQHHLQAPPMSATFSEPPRPASVPQLAIYESDPANAGNPMTVDDVTFEQILKQLSAGSDASAPQPAPQHQQERSASPAQWAGAQQQPQDTTMAPTSAPAGNTGAGGLSPRPPPPHIAVRKPTREDSIDKLRKFLKLDVNMAYAGPSDDSPTTSQMRKRSMSDSGPKSGAAIEAVMGGASGGNIDWAKFGITAGGGGGGNQNLDAVVMAATTSANGGGGNMPPPNWVRPAQPARDGQPAAIQQQGQHQQQQPTFLGSMPSYARPQSSHATLSTNNDPSSSSVGPMRSLGPSGAARDVGAGSPYPASRSSSASSRRGSFLSPHDTLPDWSFPGGVGGSAAGGPGSTRRSRKSSAAGSAHHHQRNVQSEDLSSMRFGAGSDFARQITAPDGTLVPPGGATGLYESFQYRQPSAPSSAHQRHSSFGSATSGGSGGAQQQIQPQPGFSPAAFGGSPNPAGTASSPRSPPNSAAATYASLTGVPSPGGGHWAGASDPGAASPSSSTSAYNQTALPTYGSLPGARRPRISSASSSHSSSTSSAAAAAAAGLSPSQLANPAIPNVTTSATQQASASRRKSSATFHCPVPGCNSQFTRQFNLRSHLRSHADERPFKCPAPGCGKAFARAHDAKRHHETLHLSVRKHVCEGCGRQFARLDALNRHLRPEGGIGCMGAADESGEASLDGEGGDGIDDGDEGKQGATGVSPRSAGSRGGAGGHVL